MTCGVADNAECVKCELHIWQSSYGSMWSRMTMKQLTDFSVKQSQQLAGNKHNFYISNVYLWVLLKGKQEWCLFYCQILNLKCLVNNSFIKIDWAVGWLVINGPTTGISLWVKQLDISKYSTVVHDSAFVTFRLHEPSFLSFEWAIWISEKILLGNNINLGHLCFFNELYLIVQQSVQVQSCSCALGIPCQPVIWLCRSHTSCKPN